MVVAAAPWEDVLGGVDDARLVHLTREPARDARLEPYPADLDPRLQSALIAQGVTALYGHQARAWEAARAGRHVCIVTGTASGKSLAFNLPVVAGLLEQPGSRALYVYPAKALAQDQARALAAFRGRLRPLVYDGDTPRNRRAMVRRFGNPVITNPDMLHIGLLPNHPRWAEFLAGLTHVVVDESHAYRGVFGSHVACVLRRLRRVCALYGSEPQFLLASATVANPAEAAAALTGLEVEVIDEDTAPRAERTVAFWQPILLDEASGERASALGEAAVLLATLVGQGLRTICFTKSRKGTELVYRLARDRLAAAGLEEAAERLAPYRAGYTAEVRRAIEADLVSGALLGVVATEALELGIDVGLLDCAITTGFPGTVASLRQQWGRAGRRDAGLAVFVPSEDGLDQFFARHPEALLERRVEAVIMDAANPEIRLGHVRAAADEVPITPADDAVLGPGAHETALELAAAGELRPSPAGLVWRGGGSPAAAVPLRSVGTATVVVVEAGTGAMLGTVDEMRAVSTLHDGAVYLHRGESYLVERLDLEEGVALVAPFDGRWYTQPRRETDTRILGRLEGPGRRAGVDLSYGEVEVTDHVVGYQRRELPGHTFLDNIELDLPEQRFRTRALWFDPPGTVLAGCLSPLAALHAAEHTLISVLPLYAMCDRWDIGGLSTNLHEQTGGPVVFIYEGHPGGVGLTRRGVDAFEGLVADACRIVRECPCESGCPSCVQSPKCGNLNEMLDKAGAARLLSAMLRRA
jgi:DEAD/DEAH box helicase domain-containing protein